ncbi:MAG: DNA mismatch repair protein MutS, partial [Eubacteriales bacterium]|nr:DNA mismatch repair protein MutS [Eubacteriales bacterium]
GDDITFLRKIVPGGADDSYGIAVAKLAGIPKPVLRRAKRILKDLEASAPKIEVREVEDEPEDTQITLMGMQSDEVEEKLRSVHIDTMTPLEALNLLYELQNMVT